MRRDRITAFCDWLDTVPPEPPFYEQSGFDDFADLTDGEMMAAQHELRRRAARDFAEADALAPSQGSSGAPTLTTRRTTMSLEATSAPQTKSFSGNYLVWRKVGQKLRKGSPAGAAGNPRFRHPTFAEAETEAHRLAGLFPDSTFVILQEVARVKVKAAA